MTVEHDAIVELEWARNGINGYAYPQHLIVVMREDSGWGQLHTVQDA
jgi:hypothetical protein